MSFILTFPNIETEDLLKEEVRIRYPDWKLSFSKPGFISFKVETVLNFSDLENIRLIFSKRIALFIRKETNIALDLSKESFDLEMLQLSSVNIDLTKEQRLMQISIGKEIWFAEYSSINDRLYLDTSLPDESPSRAYLKVAEAKKLFDLKIEKNQIILELGAAPGGMSFYVCKQGAYLYAVDPGLMDPLFLQNFSDHFKHVKKSVFDLKDYDLPDVIHWLMVDLNLEATVSLEVTLDLAKKFKDSKLFGVFINLKTPRVEDVSRIKIFAGMIIEAGFTNYHFFQLPSHRREFGVLILPK